MNGYYYLCNGPRRDIILAFIKINSNALIVKACFYSFMLIMGAAWLMHAYCTIIQLSRFQAHDPKFLSDLPYPQKKEQIQLDVLFFLTSWNWELAYG